MKRQCSKKAPARSGRSRKAAKGRKAGKGKEAVQRVGKRRELGKYQTLREPTETFVKDLLAGMNRSRTPGPTVAESLGVSRSRFLTWMTRGRDDEAKEAATDFAKLFLLVNAQEAEAEMDDSRIIATSMDFRARLARLERLRPETWSPPARTSNVNLAETKEFKGDPPAWGRELGLETFRVAFELGFEDAVVEQIRRNCRELLGLPLPQEEEDNATATDSSNVAEINQAKNDGGIEVSRSDGTDTTGGA